MYKSEISQIPLLPPEEELRIARQAEQGDEEAREALITANLRFAFQKAKDFYFRLRHTGLQPDDAIQNANLGLVEAVSKYNWREGTRFLSFAGWYIDFNLNRQFDNTERPIRIPIHVLYPSEKERLTGELQQHAERVKDVMSLNAKIADDPNNQEELQEIISSDESNPENIFLRSFALSQAERLLNLMHVNDRRLFMLKFRIGESSDSQKQPRSNTEIAQITNRPLGTVRTRLNYINFRIQNYVKLLEEQSQ